jgi:hypothetical protein
MNVRRTVVGIVLFFIILFSVLQNALFLAAAAVSYFSVKYSAYPLIPLAIVIDAYFGAFYTVPVLSLLSVVWVAGVEFIRPRLFVVQS